MSWLKLLLKRKILVGLLSIFIVIFGIFALKDFDIELMPDVKMDMAMVDIAANDLGTLDLEKNIIDDLEDQITGLEGIKSLDTTLSTGEASMMVTFDPGEGDEAFNDLESILSEYQNQNPDIENITSLHAGLNQPYELFYDLYGAGKGELGKLAENKIKSRLESLSEVREVSLSGITQNEVVIELDNEKFAEDDINIQGFIDQFQKDNESNVIGELIEDDDKTNLRINSNLTNVDDIKNFKLMTQDGPKPLKDYASIEVEQEDTAATAWKNGEDDYVFMQIGRTSNYTELEMTEAVRAEVEEMKKEDMFPDDVKMEEMLAAADYVDEALNSIQKNILIGGILALIIMFAFLRNVRATLIVGISIPLSIMLTFSVMWLVGYSINMMTLLALGLGIGIIVDSSIVILESIYLKLQRGLSNFEAVVEGTKEISTAVIASMLTTIVVFVPIGLLSGAVGDFIMILSLVIVITLLSSLLVSFTVIPVLSDKWIKIKNKNMNKATKKENVFIRYYGKIIDWVVTKTWRRWVVLTALVLLLISSLPFVQNIPVGGMPDTYNRQAQLLVSLEGYTDDKDKEEVADVIHETLSGTEDIADYTVVKIDRESLGVFINMTPEDDSTASQEDINSDLISGLSDLEADYPVESVASSTEGANVQFPLEVIIKGKELDELEKIADSMKDEIGEIDGIVGAHHSMADTQKEVQFNIDKDELEKRDITESDVRNQLDSLFMDQRISEIDLDNRHTPVVLRSAEEVSTLDQLKDLDINVSPEDKDDEVDLEKLVEIEELQVTEQIEHKDGQRVVKILGGFEDRDLGAIAKDIEHTIDDFDMQEGYTASFGGQIQEQQDMMVELAFILVISIFLVYVVMSVQFNHLIHPLVVMFTIPATMVGVIYGLLATGQELNIISAIGLVILIGIVLNNAILLIDRTNQLRASGMERGMAIKEAGKNRMRPIFITTLTTSVGMLPLALETGNASGYQAPMAVVVISGLLFATLVTLILIPSVYIIMEDVVGWPKRFFQKRKQKNLNKE